MVVVRYDPASPDTGTVVSVSAPQSRPNGIYGLIAVSTLVAATSWCWVSWGYRRWRRRLEQEDATDYRQDAFAGTSMSA